MTHTNLQLFISNGFFTYKTLRLALCNLLIIFIITLRLIDYQDKRYILNFTKLGDYFILQLLTLLYLHLQDYRLIS
jgi:hypothetical protein